MSQKIQIKRGIKANLPVLSSGEPALTTDTEEVFFGNGTSNIQLAKKSDLDKYVRNDIDSTINGKLSIFNNSQFLSLLSTGITSLGGEEVLSNYVLNSIGSITSIGGEESAVGGLELKQIGITSVGQEDIIGLLKLSLDLDLNGKLSINNSDLVANLNAQFLNGKQSSDFALKTDVQQESRTYAELVTMVTNNQLIAGKQYLLTDYRTKYKQPYTNVIKTISTTESLVLTANSNNTFEKICSSLNYPQDVVYYDFTNNKCEDNITPRNGFITRRIDTVKSIDCPDDWRTMLWARYYIDPNQYLIGTTLTNYEVWQEGTSAKLDVIYKDGNSLLIAFNDSDIPEYSADENVFIIIVEDITKGLSYSYTSNIKIGITINNINMYLKVLNTYGEYTTFPLGGNVERVSILEKELHNNVFLSTSGITDISLSFSCSNNTFTAYISSVDLKSYCNNNLFLGSMSNLSLSPLCYSNVFLGSCGNISLSNSCSNNTFVNSANISMGTSCSWNMFSLSCGYINIKDMSSNNHFGLQCTNISLSILCSDNVFGSNKKNLFIKNLKSKNLSSISALENRNYNTNIESRADGNYIYWNLDVNNVPQYTVIT